MLTYPLLAMLLFRFGSFVSTKQRLIEKIIMQECTRIVICKWVVSYALFMVYFEGFNFFKVKDFDPSGHISCAIASYSNWY